jgi:hypothetical protein
MFRTSEYTAWDDEGMPTRDAAGEEITKSRAKKLRNPADSSAFQPAFGEPEFPSLPAP